jgi:hypothetical protein
VLVSDEHQFIIATPTKTGTTSLVAMTQHYLRHGGNPDVLRPVRGEPMTKHRMAPPPGCGLYTRIMITRNPRARLVSMYEWLRRKPRDEAIGRAILRAEAGGDRRAGWLEMLDIFGREQSRVDYWALRPRKWGGARPYMWVDSTDTLRKVMRGRLHGQDAPWFHHGVGTEVVPIEGLDPHSLLHSIGVRDPRLLCEEVKNLNHTGVSARLFPTVEDYFDVRGVDQLLGRLDWDL